MRGYEYGGILSGIDEYEKRGVSGKMKWKSNWIRLMDKMMKF